MASERIDEVDVHLEAAELGPPRRVGRLARRRARGHAAISFAYDRDWLNAGGAFALDPSLELYAGEQYAAQDAPQFGIFLDSAPDRWGRLLMERREAHAARRERRQARALDDWDFLLGVHDHARSGALRFRAGPGGPFLDDNALAAPPLARLRELEQAARALEAPGAEQRGNYEKWLALLLAPGSSLGGARPKASFTAADGSLWLAKFPAREDRRDMGAWEYLLHGLARKAGIEVPESRLLGLSGGQRTFCARRFDRAAASRRMLASAMTLLGRRDGEAGASYLDLAQLLQDRGAPGAIDQDLEQLFRRVAFNVMAGNRDDHLRNHAFLRARGGWRLAPAFDMNPEPGKETHALALDERQTEPALATLEATAPYYRLQARRAHRIVEELREALSGWRRRARALEIPAPEIALVAPAFAHAAK